MLRPGEHLDRRLREGSEPGGLKSSPSRREHGAVAVCKYSDTESPGQLSRRIQSILEQRRTAQDERYFGSEMKEPCDVLHHRCRRCAPIDNVRLLARLSRFAPREVGRN